jgi:hypothetical protein
MAENKNTKNIKPYKPDTVEYEKRVYPLRDELYTLLENFFKKHCINPDKGLQDLKERLELGYVENVGDFIAQAVEAIIQTNGEVID